MASTNAFEINGVIDTSQSVLANMNTICTASGCWLTFDVNTGLWSVVINKAGSSVKSFNDTNIIGSISISSTGINELYNAVSIEFPHVDLRDQTDYIDLEIPEADRFPNELDNKMQIKLECINNPVQAQYIASVELKQSRVDKVIQFTTDYSSIGLKGGDIIDVTSEMYGYTNKKFRITKLTEDDSDDGNIQLQITALEYSESVYDDSGLVRTERNKKTGIIPKSQNTALTGSDNEATANSLNDALKNQALLLALLKAFGPTTQGGSGVLSQVRSFALGALQANFPTGNTISLGATFTAPMTGVYKFRYYLNWGSQDTSRTPGPAGCFKTSVMSITKNGTIIPNLGNWAFTGDGYVQLYEDHVIEGFASITTGDVLELGATLTCDWGPDYARYTVDIATGSIIQVTGQATDVPVIIPTVEIYYIGGS